jgi:phytanoyl-CoA hydroxylase
MLDWPTGVKPHPWSEGFQWIGPTGPYLRLSTDQAASFSTDGFVILPAALLPKSIDKVRSVADELEKERQSELDAKGGREGISETKAITFSSHLAAKSAVLTEFVKNEVFAELCCDLIGPDVNLYWDQAVYKKPENPRRFPWHQDNGYTFVLPQQYLTCWTPLTEATVDNGCPQIVPGMHKLGTLKHTYVDPLGWECFADPPAAPVAAPVEPGDVVVFSSLSPHLTGPNVTTSTRKSYIVQFAPAGAEVLLGNPAEGPPTGRKLCDNPDWQFAVVRGGTPVGGGTK